MGGEISGAVGVGNLIIAAVSITAVILFGVWRMFSSYETRNDAAHERLGARIDTVGNKVDGVKSDVDYMRGLMDGERNARGLSPAGPKDGQ